METWSDPYNTGSAGGYDYAVVRLDDARDSTSAMQYSGVTPPPQPPYSPSPVTVYSGRSGTLAGSITAALAILGDVHRIWLNVWQFGSQQRLQHGDSGSLAMVTGGRHANSLLGHFVGGAGTTPGVFDHQYIQDLDSCLVTGLGRLINI